jgi:hypothetical protein
MKPDPKLKLVVGSVANFEAVNFGEERKSHSCDFSGVEITVPGNKNLVDSLATDLSSIHLSGNPETTMYASPIVSTLYTSKCPRILSKQV